MKQTEHRFIVDTADRIDKYLSEKLEDISRSRIKAIIEEGNVSLDGIVVEKAGAKISPGSVIEVVVIDSEVDGLIPEAISLNIIFEDDQVIVINKSADMVVHPGAGNPTGTVVNALLAHYPPIRHVGESDRPGVVHRLDKDTSGVLIFAKTEKSYKWLVKQFKSHDIKKTYLALVDGHPPTPTGRIEAPIERDRHIRTRMAVGLRGQGKMAVSEYFEVERFNQHTLVEVLPITGRTHQIRVHLNYIGTPVAGDTIYGHRKPSIDMGRFFLHAKSLAVKLPGDRALRTFEAPLPGDLDEVLQTLRRNERQ